MSFILDALKKAESERNRNSGPVLMDVRISAPRRRLPVWAWMLGSVLLANLAVLGWLLLRPAPARRAASADTAITAAPAARPGHSAHCCAVRRRPPRQPPQPPRPPAAPTSCRR